MCDHDDDDGGGGGASWLLRARAIILMIVRRGIHIDPAPSARQRVHGDGMQGAHAGAFAGSQVPSVIVPRRLSGFLTA